MSILAQFQSSPFFVARTPLYPFNEFLNLSQDLASSLTHDEDRLQNEYENDRELIRSRLLHFVSRPEVQEALWIASPELHEQIHVWRENPNGKKGQRIERTLYRYFARMTARATPFGLFSGCCVGRVGENTVLAMESRSSYRRRSRLDMEYLCAISDRIAANKDLRSGLRFRPNTSLYHIAGRFHFSQAKSERGSRKYLLVAAEETPYLTATLERATLGQTPRHLAQLLTEDDPEVGLDEAEAYIEQLIDSQILVCELTPNVTGPDPTQRMIALLRDATGLEDIAGTLSTVKNQLTCMDTFGVGVNTKHYEEILASVSKLSASFKVGRLIQVDMMKSSPRAQLGESTINDIMNGIEILHALTVPIQQDSLLKFARTFAERYQDQEIPLVQVLDEETGIGFERSDGPSSEMECLLRGMHFAQSTTMTGMRWRTRDSFLLAKLLDHAKGGGLELALQEKDLNALKESNSLPLPDAFSVMVTLAGFKPANLNQGSIAFDAAFGPSGATLLGRFCDADKSVEELVREHIFAEEHAKADKNVVFAEVAHLPQGRVGNVLFRPRLRKYEIPFLASSGVSSEFQIPITDLVVSVRAEKIVLRSIRLGKEVIPRLTSAHGYFGNLNLKAYKFLCLLQNQGSSLSLFWDWGLLQQVPFLPRIRYGKFVFSRARWQVSQNELQRLAEGSGGLRYRRTREWKKELHLPRFVYLTEHDNEMLIDFDNPLSVDTFIEYVKQRSVINLTEMFPDPESLSFQGPEGSFVHQIIVPFVRTVNTSETLAATASMELSAQQDNSSFPQSERIKPETSSNAVVVRRNFVPGSEWLFVKLYASPYHVDWLLTNIVPSLIKPAMTTNRIDRWFFVRYGDPEWHLRLRFHGDRKWLLNEFLPQLHEQVDREVSNHRLSKVQLDTYQPEVERYGGPQGLDVSERMFWVDSEAILEMLSVLSRDNDAEARWKTAVRSADILMSTVGFDLDAKLKFAADNWAHLSNDLALTDIAELQIATRFREEKRGLESILEDTVEDGILPGLVRASLVRLSQRLLPIARELASLERGGILTRTIRELASSYVHMHLNRFLRSSQRSQEAVIYNFLLRFYESKVARRAKMQLRANTSAYPFVAGDFSVRDM